MTESDVEAAIRSYARARMYSAATVERWLGLARRDGDALLQLATELRLGENQLRDLWDWAEEIGERDGLALSQVFAAEPIAATRARELGRNDKLKAIKAALRRLRYPQLTAVETRLAELVRTLELPRSIRIMLPEHLEGDCVRVEIVADSVASWRAAAAALLTAADARACAELFALLDEAP